MSRNCTQFMINNMLQSFYHYWSNNNLAFWCEHPHDGQCFVFALIFKNKLQQINWEEKWRKIVVFHGNHFIFQARWLGADSNWLVSLTIHYELWFNKCLVYEFLFQIDSCSVASDPDTKEPLHSVGQGKDDPCYDICIIKFPIWCEAFSCLNDLRNLASMKNLLIFTLHDIIGIIRELSIFYLLSKKL